MYFWDLKTKFLSFVYLFNRTFDEFQVLVEVPFPTEEGTLFEIPWLEIDLVGYR